MKRKKFRVVIAGSRDFNDYDFLEKKMDHLLQSQQDCRIIIVSGTARGADSLGERYAMKNGYPIIRVPAKWESYGRSAGPKRNKEMAIIADAVVCFVPHTGVTKGTSSMIEEAKKEDVSLRIIIFGQEGVKNDKAT
jgi:hypothetical protein